MKKLLTSICTSVNQCKIFIISIFIMYCFSCSIGIIMVHTGNEFALYQRDKIVNDAVKNDKASTNYQAGNHFTAAMYDAMGNLFFAAVPQTLLGLGIVPPYFTVCYQGWVGGIVSVDYQQHSRFEKIKPAIYYFTVLLLQFLPFSITIGAGVKTGVELYKQNIKTGWRFRNYRIRKENIRDIINLYIISIPLFLIASLFEFFSSWNI